MLSCLLQLACCIEKLHRVEQQEVYAGLSFTVGVFCGNLAFVEGQQVCALGNHHVSSRLHPERPCMLVCCLECE